MSTQSIKLNKGDLFTLKGQQLKVAITTKVKAIKLSASPKVEAVGEAKSDVDHQRFQRIACRIIENRIKALEREEANALCSIKEDDVLFLFDPSEDIPFLFDEVDDLPKTSFSDQIGRTSIIMELKKILKQLKAL